MVKETNVGGRNEPIHDGASIAPRANGFPLQRTEINEVVEPMNPRKIYKDKKLMRAPAWELVKNDSFVFWMHRGINNGYIFEMTWYKQGYSSSSRGPELVFESYGESIGRYPWPKFNCKKALAEADAHILLEEKGYILEDLKIPWGKT